MSEVMLDLQTLIQETDTDPDIIEEKIFTKNYQEHLIQEN